MGRKKKPGPRGKTGRLLKARDHGNDNVQARAALFRCFHGESSTGHEMTCAGRLMLVGAFDGMEHDPETCLAALLAYANGYWGNYGGGAKIGSFERRDRSHDNSWDDPRGEWFDDMDARLRDAGHQARVAVHQVSVDRVFFPDEDVGWASRIINSALVRRKLPVAGELACDSDLAMLELLRAGVSALIGQKLRKVA